MSEIKVNKISPKQLCTQLTLGDSGDTIIIPAGATITNNGTATGFGRSGTVNWDTTKKTTGFTAVNGVGYFCDTTSTAFTATLPLSPSAGDIVAFSDYTGTWATNNLTVGRNSSNINGTAADLILNTNNTTATLIYVDATEGWRLIDTGSLSSIFTTPQYVAATGGTITTCGNYKIHSFTGPGTFTVTCAGNSVGSSTVDYLIVAGGGGGGGDQPNGYGAAGGGAGGFRESKATGAPWTASPLASSTSLPVSATAYPITVGAGGAAGSTGPAGGQTPGVRGGPSTFSTITSTGGGGGWSGNTPYSPTYIPGGSGGGGAGPGNGCNATGGTGNTPPVSPSQGSNGGNARGPANPPNSYGGGGGGGATVAGTPFAISFSPPINRGGPGGTGATTSITGSPISYAGGGGGGTYTNFPSTPTVVLGGQGGTGGGGTGGNVFPGNSSCASAGSTNTGGGGGGGGSAFPSTPGVVSAAAGGSGIVVIRYKFQ